MNPLPPTLIAERLRLLEAVSAIVRRAGEAVMSVYGTDFVVHGKADDSPVTEADRRAEAILTDALQRLLPGVPVVAEEAVAAGEQPTLQPGERFWLVDPVDGTREFVARNGEFTVNVALVERGEPVLGVVQAPALGLLYAGGPALGAWCETDRPNGAPERRAIACRQVPTTGLTVTASRHHGDGPRQQALLQRLGVVVADTLRVGSSLKFCQIASGHADLYPRLGRTMEWDVAAGQAVLAGAGGRVQALAGGPLRYGKPGWENPDFVAWGRR